MNLKSEYRVKLQEILREEGLLDIAQYHKADFFDEVPLYSRFSTVSFLKHLNRDEADKILLEFALQFFEKVGQYETPKGPCFAAITIWNDPEDELIVPNIFVCNNMTDERVRNHLVLHEVSSEPSKRTKRLFSELCGSDTFVVLEDSSTLSDMTRVFIGHRNPDNPHLVPIYSFERTSSSHRQQA